MAAFAYWLATMGFIEAGWSKWRSMWWPYYLAKTAGRAALAAMKEGEA